ncbi:2-amino-4-hydroxy-6-hydroxymethyldihydropteridine diphosphokinase [Alteraurantiacibacter buctensis]|uniref:2-amino-4-hydroxy-6- hydroxymethyldihydropteridine diphosphokinase n=1 Tax=Alteraurantiacibacter buctensis TaxID=1503981 RepID=UPI00301CCE3A
MAAAAGLIDETLGRVLARSPIIASAPIGPSLRRYANATLVLDSALDPHELLTALQWLEAQLGRKRRGQRWRSRVIDLDIVLWSGGLVADPDLKVPHPLFRQRDFVLRPAAAIAPHWRDPLTGLTLAHLHARLTRRRPLPR